MDVDEEHDYSSRTCSTSAPAMSGGTEPDIRSAFSKSSKVRTKAHGKSFAPWIEKYRPQSISEVAHQKHVTSVLSRACDSENLPHLLFYGPPGTGKTSCVLALARDLFPHSMLKARVLELNASDERGINVIRTKVKDFAQYSVASAATVKADGKSVPPFKIIILDEADSMTRDAQTALRRTMEKYSAVTRFCLICNYVSRIIAPVASRCAKFRFQPLSEASMKWKLAEISELESLKLGSAVLDTIVLHSGGDMRKAINLLQSASLMCCGDAPVTVDDVRQISVSVPRDLVEKALCACKTRSFESVRAVAKDFICSGFPGDLVLSAILDVAMASSELSNVAKAKIAIKLGEADRKLVDGASEFLQIMDVLGTILQQFPAPF